MATLYGIRNCDTCRRARAFLDGAGVSYVFHDLREDGFPDGCPGRWLEAVGADRLINRRSTSWRRLSETDRSRLRAEPATLLGEYPTLIRRPLLESEDGTVVAGFSETEYRRALHLE